MKRRTLLILVLLVVIAAGSAAVYLWNKPKRTAASEEAVTHLTASELFNRYTQDLSAANSAYLDKVIAVSGVVAEQNESGQGVITLTLHTDDPMGAVTCTFTPGQRPTVPPGGTIHLKGICTGIQGDLLPTVVLSQCSEASNLESH